MTTSPSTSHHPNTATTGHVTSPTIHHDMARAIAETADPTLRTVLQRLLNGAQEEELRTIGLATLSEEAGVLLNFIETRPLGRHKLRIRQSLNGQSTVIEILNDDMPFLVDSIVGEIQARAMEAQVILHPIFKVTRTPDGKLLGPLENPDRSWGDGRQESLIFLMLPPLAPDIADDLGRRISEVLIDVRRAVADWHAMRQATAEAADGFRLQAARLNEADRHEARAFLSWLADGHFTLLGIRRYATDAQARLTALPSASLGVLRDHAYEPLGLADSPPEMGLEITKSRDMARVHRRAPYDVIRVPLFAPTFSEGAIPTGELRIIGLFTSSAYVEPPRQIPYLREKVQRVIAEAGYPAESHAGKALANVLNTFPRDELFQIDVADLTRWARAIVDLELRPRVRVFVRHDRLDRLASILVFAPRDRYSSEVRRAISDTLAKGLGGDITSFQPAFLDSGLVRIHFVLARAAAPRPEATTLEAEIADHFRNWDDKIAQALAETGQPSAVHARVAARMPKSYRDTTDPKRALIDMALVSGLTPASPLKVDFYRPQSPEQAGRRMRALVVRLAGPMPLSDRVPLLENLGFAVVEESTHIIRPADGTDPSPTALHVMELETNDGPAADAAASDDRLEQAFLAVAQGRAANDRFNRLITAAGATWREVAILRAYATYLRQLGVPFGISAIADALNQNGGIVRDLVELFHARFNPDFALNTPPQPNTRHDHQAAILQRIDSALAQVQSLDEDRIIRHMLSLLNATVRTNAFQHPADSAAADTFAFKLDPRVIDAMPQPKPYREIWVSGPRVEGVHLRFGPVARGGLRWSDRPTDFRTEVLGLVKAQLVKNAVIVPTGAKGGFVPKLLPRNGTREAIQAEGTAAYMTFIGALLDVTDNIKDGHIVPPHRVVRHDTDDPYLVVAADKGTATFSDTANAISAERGHWLDDAFASGGSAGYDHKKMGITARGAWECVTRHFREMGIDIAKQSITVMGVGDMSGDVFGNGMLLSRHLKVVAAFDHRDIFIDPNPVPEVAFAERARLFALPRSSWQDYDRSKLSQGGMIAARASKSIPLTPEARALLGLAADVAALPPNEVMRAILKVKADLMWLGGIGTYVRAASETDDQVGDRANDAIRITGNDLNVAVVGEGANLGLTQRGRMEFAARGGRLNTDFIDNSAGVNSSDQEVNIKIALSSAIASGALQAADRNALLATMTDDVARACLANNHAQGLALSLALATSAQDLGAYARLMDDLEGRALLDRRLESLPSRSEMTERGKSARGMLRPELCPLLSFSKIALTQDLLQSTLPEQLPALAANYFAPSLRQRFPKAIAGHRLIREIAATEAANLAVNRLGPAGVRFISDATGRTPAEVVGATLTAQDLTGIDALWRKLDEQDGHLPHSEQFALYQKLADAAATQTLNFARAGIGLDGPEALPQAQRSAALAVVKALNTQATDRAPPTADEPLSQALPLHVTALDRLDDLALILASSQQMRLPLTPQPSDGGSHDHGATSVEHIARAFQTIDQHIPFAALARRLARVPVSDYYDKLALSTAATQLKAAQRTVVDAWRTQPSTHAGRDMSAWLAGRKATIEPLIATVHALIDDPNLTVSRTVVGAGQLTERARELSTSHP